MSFFAIILMFIPANCFSRAHGMNEIDGRVSRSTVPLHRRQEIGAVLEAEGFTTGAELGVQAGVFAAEILQNWTSCKKYYLIDVWASQENYLDQANKVDHEAVYNTAMANTAPWKEIVEPMRMFTSEAAHLIPDNSLDFIYVDARHDYCGVTGDINAYWPKLKPNGILAGHDYLTSEEVKILSADQDWSVCGNGKVVPLAVKGAVDDFARSHGLTVTLFSYGSADATWPSWGIRKPCASDPTRV